MPNVTFDLSVSATVPGGVINSATVNFPKDSAFLLGPAATVSGSHTTDVTSPFLLTVNLNSFPVTTWEFSISSPGRVVTCNPPLTNQTGAAAVTTVSFTP